MRMKWDEIVDGNTVGSGIWDGGGNVAVAAGATASLSYVIRTESVECWVVPVYILLVPKSKYVCSFAHPS